MTIYPAIDLRKGRCVRLFQGKADQETVYFEDPAEPANNWRNAGATHLHVVDLDGAFDGASANPDAVRSILEVKGLKVQLGGGMRNEKAIERALSLGLNRVIIGTRACSEPEWVGDLIKKFGSEKIVVGIDAKDGLVATKGWVETSKTEAIALAKQLEKLGVRWIIHTDVATDGAMKGPNLEAQQKMAEAVPNIEGVIVGKALYEGTVSLENLCT